MSSFKNCFYPLLQKTTDGLKVVSDVLAENLDKELERKITIPKNKKKKIEDVKDFDDLSLVVYTQPKNTGIGKKKPELFEMAIGGKKEEKLNYAKGILGKEIKVEDIFKEGSQIDIHAITKGKGIQGPVKRFGIGLKSHKSAGTGKSSRWEVLESLGMRREWQPWSSPPLTSMILGSMR